MNLQEKFETIGGQFISSISELKSKLKNISCLIFDWDGVFNNGEKIGDKGSSFSESDSMGINMLRFSYWLIHDAIPITVILTGEQNQSAVDFAKREHFDDVLLNAKNKAEAFSMICDLYHLSPEQTLVIFDDIIDLSMVIASNLSFCVKRTANPLFNEFIVRHKMCDYISGHTGGNHAIREIAELIIGLQGNYDETVLKRIKQKGAYEKYLSARNTTKTLFKKLP